MLFFSYFQLTDETGIVFDVYTGAYLPFLSLYARKRWAL